MKKKKAILILNQQSDKLKKLELFTTHNWTVETRTYLTEFFGKESYQTEHFRMNLTDIKSDQKKEQVIDFLNNCANIISNKGLHKPSTENWFSKLPNWLFSLGLTALFGLGIVIGNVTNDKQNFELRQENKELKNKLLSIPADSITNKKDLSNKPKQEY
jgi:hypothetical protein